jgi:hypothetical protein
MKWYETSLTVQWDNALKLLNQGRAEAYVKALRRIHALVKEREKQVFHDSDMLSMLFHYQGIDALLYMEQSKLRVMTDEDLSISRVGLMADCGALLNEKLSSKQELSRARQALEKILREQRRRSNVYGLDFDYWA